MPRQPDKNRHVPDVTSAEKCLGFSPVTALNPRGLILGSMPGIKSLAAGEYYAHPQNVFWKILSQLFDMPAHDYAARLRIITQNHLALWDVLKYCERAGSLDSAIKNDTIETNDFTAFLTQHKNIRYIFLNGGKAAQEFKRRVMPHLPPDIAARLTLIPLPSTSPAHAGMRYDEKIKAWQSVKA